MRTQTALLLAFLAFACGSEASELSLEGEWLQVDEDGVCAKGAVFEAGAFEFQYICELASGGYGAQVRTGSYTDNGGGSLTLTLQRSSCVDDAAGSQSATYRIEHGQLSLGDSSLVVIYDPLEDQKAPGGGATVESGCWTQDGFTPGPVAPVH